GVACIRPAERQDCDRAAPFQLQGHRPSPCRFPCRTRLPAPCVPASLRRMNGPALHRVLACLLLAGCALVDQKTFAPAPEAKAQPAAAPAPPAAVRFDARTPLVTIDFGGPPPSYEELLRYAVRAAEKRDGAVQYDVIAMLPKPTDA